MSFELRPYQVDIIDRVRAAMLRGVKGILCVAPTGSGKTVLTAKMLLTAASKNMASTFIVHRRELVKQSIRTFAGVGVKHGVIASGWFEDKDPLIQIASVNTFAKRFSRFRRPRLIIWDECHHIAASTWAAIRNAFPDAFHVGLTATPERLDGKGLDEFFDVIIDGPTPSWLIENKFLSPYRLFSPGGPSVDGVHKRMGDFVKSELETAVDKPTITGNAIAHYQKRAGGKRAIVRCVSIEHSKHVAEQFNAAGINALHVDGKTPDFERDQAMAEFVAGRVLILCNVDLFSEGVDVPAVECVIDMRPTTSLILWLQFCGRALRVSPGKEYAIILDHAGNLERHGLPCQERAWSLKGRMKGSSGSAGEVAPVKVCPKCFAAQVQLGDKCSFCGHEFEKKGGRKIDEVAGELVEIDVAAIRAKRLAEQAAAGDDEEALVQLAKNRGYKRPRLWARHVMMSRAQKKAQREAEAKWGAP